MKEMPKFGNEPVTLGMQDIKDPAATDSIHHDYSAV